VEGLTEFRGEMRAQGLSDGVEGRIGQWLFFSVEGNQPGDVEHAVEDPPPLSPPGDTCLQGGEQLIGARDPVAVKFDPGPMRQKRSVGARGDR